MAAPAHGALRKLRRFALPGPAAEFDLGSAGESAPVLLAVADDILLGRSTATDRSPGVRLTVDLAALSPGADRVSIAVVGEPPGDHEFTLTSGESVERLRTAAAARVVGTCHRRGDQWWFTELGIALPDESAVLRALGPEAAALYRDRQGPVWTEVVEPRRPVRALPPPSLESARLGGTREVRGAVSLEVAVDMSPSMTAYAGLRTAALHALIGFARGEMAETDTLTSVAFAGQAAELIRPTPVHRLGRVAERPRGQVGVGTELIPALRLLKRLRRASPVRPDGRALMVITDAELFDEGRELAAQLRNGGYQQVFFMVPGEVGQQLPVYDLRWLKRVHVRFFRDATELGLIYGEVCAVLTGQTLEAR